VILDEQYGLCPQVRPPEVGGRYPSLPYWLAQRRQRRETLGEEMRLLYVACTRACDLLLLSGSRRQNGSRTVGRTRMLQGFRFGIVDGGIVSRLVQRGFAAMDSAVQLARERDGRRARVACACSRGFDRGGRGRD
jgi:ATP-dependent exoDNAse (exonuclease V) beta subunit